MTRIKTCIGIEDKPEPVEVMEKAILDISEGIKKLRSTRLNDKALCLLISHACSGVYPKPSPSLVKTVLDGIQSLEETFLKKVQK